MYVHIYTYTLQEHYVARGIHLLITVTVFTNCSVAERLLHVQITSTQLHTYDDLVHVI